MDLYPKTPIPFHSSLRRFLSPTTRIYELPYFLGLFQSNPDDPFTPTTRSLPWLNSLKSRLHKPPTTSTPIVLLPNTIRTFFNMLITRIICAHGHIWRTGFQNNELKTIVFDDVPEALENWHALGIKVYIYSSGSRLAQRLIFGDTNYGDLRKYLCGFFDTIVRNKKETSSYVEISKSMRADRPSEILFVTDVYQEAIATKAASLEVIIFVRPGNGPLLENHSFKTVNPFSEI